MNISTRTYWSLSLIMVFTQLTGCQWLQSEPQSLVLRFHPFVGDSPLIFNTSYYPNPGGAGNFTVRDFQVFISNLRLMGKNIEFNVPESYHLARFDSQDGYYELQLELPSAEKFELLELGIGVDPTANGTLTISGDLDPNSRMAWSWDVGYKFILLEGTLKKSGSGVPLVYHVGFNENYRTSIFNIPDGRQTLDFKVDIYALFTANGYLDLARLPTVKFDQEDSARIGAGFERLVSLCKGPCGKGH